MWEPWIMTWLLKSSHTKLKLFKKKLSKPTGQNITQYKIYVHLYNKLKDILKSIYYKKIIEENKYNMKNTWMIFNA